jgi:hypothetical protein
MLWPVEPHLWTDALGADGAVVRRRRLRRCHDLPAADLPVGRGCRVASLPEARPSSRGS